MDGPHAAATLLYVEDDCLIQECVALALRDAGFLVVTAENGNTAIRILETATEPFLGLITDVNLGNGPDGWDIARRARELADMIRVVYVSGASQDKWTAQGVPHSIMIAKPFEPLQIVGAISALLSAVGA